MLMKRKKNEKGFGLTCYCNFSENSCIVIHDFCFKELILCYEYSEATSISVS